MFPVETKYLPGVKRRVELARDIETADHRMKKEFRYLDWFETQAKEADLDFDLAENYLAAEDEVEVSKKKKKRENQEEEEKRNDGRRRKNQMERELGVSEKEKLSGWTHVRIAFLQNMLLICLKQAGADQLRPLRLLFSFLFRPSRLT